MICRDEGGNIFARSRSHGEVASQLERVEGREFVSVEQFAGTIKDRIRKSLSDKSTLQVPLEGGEQFVSESVSHLTNSLTFAKRRPDFDLGQRENGQLITGLAAGKGEHSLSAYLADVELDQSTAVQVVEHLLLTPLPDDCGRHWLAKNFHRMKIHLFIVGLTENRLHFRHEPIKPYRSYGKLRCLGIRNFPNQDESPFDRQVQKGMALFR